MVGDKIKEARVLRNITQLQLSQLLDGISLTTISEWENNKTTPSFKNLGNLANKLNLKKEFFLSDDNAKIKDYDLDSEKSSNSVEKITGEPPYNNDGGKKEITAYIVEGGSPVFKFKLLRASAGNGVIVDDRDYEEYAMSENVLNMICNGHFLGKKLNQPWIDDNILMVKIEGDSMEPDIKEDSRAVIERGENIENGKIYLINHNNETKVKKLYRIDENTVLLVSTNEKYKPIEASLKNGDSIKLIGLYLGSIYVPKTKNNFDFEAYLNERRNK